MTGLCAFIEERRVWRQGELDRAIGAESIGTDRSIAQEVDVAGVDPLDPIAGGDRQRHALLGAREAEQRQRLTLRRVSEGVHEEHPLVVRYRRRLATLLY